MRHNAVQYGDRIVTIDYCDVTSPYLCGFRKYFHLYGKGCGSSGSQQKEQGCNRRV